MTSTSMLTEKRTFLFTLPLEYVGIVLEHLNDVRFRKRRRCPPDMLIHVLGEVCDGKGCPHAGLEGNDRETRKLGGYHAGSSGDIGGQQEKHSAISFHAPRRWLCFELHNDRCTPPARLCRSWLLFDAVKYFSPALRSSEVSTRSYGVLSPTRSSTALFVVAVKGYRGVPTLRPRSILGCMLEKLLEYTYPCTCAEYGFDAPRVL